MRQMEWKASRPAKRSLRRVIISGIAADWQRIFTALFSGMFLISFIHWFGEEDGGFLPKTILLLYSTLAIVFLTEAARLKNRFLQRALQFLILLVFYAISLDYTPVWAETDNTRQLFQLFLYNAEQLFPYLWFGIGAWIIYLFTIWWMGNKKRIVSALIAGVLVMALRDSFSLVYLWDEAAWLILCGLFLLVVRHFSNLKDKSPEGWGYIADYPISFITPIVLLLTVTVGLSTLAPDVTNVLTDPYTLYKKWEGEPVTVPGKLKELTSPILPSVKTTSGYSRDDSALGGGFEYDYATVFTVDTTYRSYWRGETKDVYTGQGWKDSGGDRSNASEIGGKNDLLKADSRLDISKRKTIEVKQTVTFLDKSPKYPVLFGAFELKALESVDEKEIGYSPAVWQPGSSEMHWGEDGRPKTYTILSEMPVLDEAGLKEAPAEYPEKKELDEYLELPESVPERVRQLAVELTKDEVNPYAKAKAIERYLQTTFPYNNQPDESNSSSKDFVDRFLFETKEGYCDYYSTAMAVLTRSIGLPSRWVKGYTSGSSPFDEMSPQEMMSRMVDRDPNGAGRYTVHNSNAHSWVEVYFSGYGWIPFDPTSGFSVPYAVDSTQAANDPVVDDTPIDETTTNPTEQTNGHIGLWITSATILLLVAAAGIWYYAGYRRGRWILRKGSFSSFRNRAETNYNRQLIKEFEKLLRYFRRRGFPVLDHETARETLNRWRVKDAWLSQDFDKLIALFEKAKYSSRVVTEEEAARAAGIVRKLRKEM
ncbi:DUF4129 domain-containing transglutaminase family protein [Gorillibacterium timonense]|uniref:DUF4129 domain-containing transglutaminase family protein n=1 Tax=Gorillibacterium timonense TaxID=1689269 RepID=UPI00071DA9F0|nr:transglutaminase domain-containing protein [Gorillibacterium timonense]